MNGVRDKRGLMRLIARVGNQQLVRTRSSADAVLPGLSTMASDYDIQVQSLYCYCRA